MIALIEVLHKSCDFLSAQGIESPRKDVERLIAHVLKIKRLEVYLQHDRPLLENELACIREGLRRLAKHEPIQYIEGEVAFHNALFLVNQNVLIPRPETELLVEMAVAAARQKETSSILDMCTGSGCIGISVKKELPQAHVVLADISKAALDIAYKNMIKNKVDVGIVESDLFANLSDRRFDVIVCNPPYISKTEYEALDQSVIRYEPQLALVSGPSGLEVYEKIAAEARKYMHPEARLLLEIGASQGQSVQTLFLSRGYAEAALRTDFSGRERYLTIIA